MRTSAKLLVFEMYITLLISQNSFLYRIANAQPILTFLMQVHSITLPILLKVHGITLFILLQVHSITARSVSRNFRESLKNGKAEVTDTIFKLPEAKHSTGTLDTVRSTNNRKGSKKFSTDLSNTKYIFAGQYYLHKQCPK